VVALLVDVLAQVVGELGRNQITWSHRPRALARRLHERHARAYHAMPHEEVVGIEIADPRMVQQPLARPHEPAEDQPENAAQTVGVSGGRRRLYGRHDAKWRRVA
jgi:hypothetical protein